MVDRGKRKATLYVCFEGSNERAVYRRFISREGSTFSERWHNLRSELSKYRVMVAGCRRTGPPAKIYSPGRLEWRMCGDEARY